MAVSEWFSDENLISELRMFFTEDERANIDFQSYLGQLTDVDESTWQVKIKDRLFNIDKVLCSVEEVNN